MSAPAPAADRFYSDVCHVGPLGRMVALPDVAPGQGVAAPLRRIGGMHESLRGGVTIDTFAVKQSWTWSYEHLLEEQVAHLEALQRGLIPGPLRLIDPRRANRLPVDFASGGSESASPAAYRTDAGSVCYYHPLSDAGTADISTLGPWRLLRGYQEWQIVAAAADAGNFITPRDERYADGRARVPVLPGEVLSVSVWVLGLASSAARLQVNFFDRAGVITGTTITPSTALSLSGWLRFGGQVTVPATAVAAYPLLRTGAGEITSGTSVYATGWSLGDARGAPEPPWITRVCSVDDVGAGWRVGGGAPYVVPEVTGGGYSLPGLYSHTLTLLET